MNKCLKSLKHNLAHLKDDHRIKFRHKKTKLGPRLTCEVQLDKRRKIEWSFTLYGRNQYLGASLAFFQKSRKNKDVETFHLSEVLKGMTIPGISSSSLEALKEAYEFSEDNGTIIAGTSPKDMVEIYSKVIKDDIDDVIKEAEYVLN